MTDRPIIFSAPMVRALLREAEQPGAGKTMTRRILKPQPQPFTIDDRGTLCEVAAEQVEGDPCPRVRLGRVITKQEVRYAVGDRLWVRETWQLHGLASDVATVVYAASINASWTEAHEQFPATLAKGMTPVPFQERWRSPIHMPRWASRLTLLVTAVKIERLQDITAEDAEAEGVGPVFEGAERRCATYSAIDATIYRDQFAKLWNSLHGAGAWDANPWVVAISFRPVLRNVDQVAAAPARGEAEAG